MRRYSHQRSKLIADQIQKDIVDTLMHKVRDPRIKWVTINDVEVDEDQSSAKIYWTVLDDTKRQEVIQALASATGFIRTELARKFHTYTIPHLKFVFDDSILRGTKILDIINKANNK